MGEELARFVHDTTQRLAPAAQHELVARLRRAADTVAAALAEAAAPRSKGDRLRSLALACGALNDLRLAGHLAHGAGCLAGTQYVALRLRTEHAARHLGRLIGTVGDCGHGRGALAFSLTRREKGSQKGGVPVRCTGFQPESPLKKTA